MGADMLVEFFTIPRRANIENYLNKMKEDVDNMTPYQIDIVFMDVLEMYEDEEGFFEDKEIKEQRETIKKLIDEAEEWLYSRQVAIFDYGEETFYLTGGMSWGDYPTEACQPIYNINCIKWALTQEEEEE